MRNRVTLPLIVLALVVAACGTSGTTDEDEPLTTEVTDTTTVSSTSSSLPTTTVAPDTTSTGEASAPSTTTEAVVFTVSSHGLHPDALPGSDGWLGSGCSPGADQLPDGIWWGYTQDLSPTSVTFDLACLGWIDDPDDDALEEAGWVIENNNTTTRVVPVDADALVTCLEFDCPEDPFAFIQWIEDEDLLHGEGGDDGIWLYVNDGVVTEVGQAVLAG